MFVDWFKNMSAMFVYVYEIYATAPFSGYPFDFAALLGWSKGRCNKSF